MNGLIEYRAHPFWLQKYCPSHEMDHTPRCCSCERMEVLITFRNNLSHALQYLHIFLDLYLGVAYDCSSLYLTKTMNLSHALQAYTMTMNSSILVQRLDLCTSPREFALFIHFIFVTFGMVMYLYWYLLSNILISLELQSFVPTSTGTIRTIPLLPFG